MFELKVVKFEADVVTTSVTGGCANPSLPKPIGDAEGVCPGGV